MLFQIAYTSVFGAFAVFVQLRTGVCVCVVFSFLSRPGCYGPACAAACRAEGGLSHRRPFRSVLTWCLCLTSSMTSFAGRDVPPIIPSIEPSLTYCLDLYVWGLSLL